MKSSNSFSGIVEDASLLILNEKSSRLIFPLLKFKYSSVIVLANCVQVPLCMSIMSESLFVLVGALV